MLCIQIVYINMYRINPTIYMLHNVKTQGKLSFMNLSDIQKRSEIHTQTVRLSNK